ncbi:MAG: discoidin domain-containing protein [Planctomycetaceae bacterium]
MVNVNQIAAGVVIAILICGCGSGPTPPQGTANSVDSPEAKIDAGTSPATHRAKIAETPEKPLFDEQLKSVTAAIDPNNWDVADAQLAALRESLGDAATGDQLAKISDVERTVSAAREEIRREQRQKMLGEAKAEYDNGEWGASLKQIAAIAALAPTESERIALNELRTSIDEAMKAERRLASWIKLLGSSDAGEVKAAQTQLLEEPETALPLVRQAIRRNDAATTKNSLELLRKMRQPELSLPIMVGVLESPDQQANWDVAVKEMLRLEHPGAGPQLLQLAVSSTIAEQRQAALSALANVVDPPADAVLSLLPSIFQEGPEIPAALSATTHAVLVNHQHDVHAWRGLRETLTAAEEKQLEQIADRLTALQALPAEQQATVDAARQLAIALRFASAEPMTGLQILEASPTDPTVKPAALLDGVWNGTDLTSMWWTPVSQPGFVVIDLGETKTVTGVRIWNFNEVNAGYRGWKDVEVFVSDTPTALRPVSQGVLLPAPGIPEAHDYSQVMGVDFVRGRYVKLVCKAYLANSSHAGLSEVQVLGY